MSDEPVPETKKSTPRELAQNIALWLVFWGGILALFWFFPGPMIGVTLMLLLLRFLSS